METTLYIVAITVHIASHFFLVRFFKWYDEKSKLNSPWVKWFLLIPPFALIVTLFLVGLGLILQLFKLMRK